MAVIPIYNCFHPVLREKTNQVKEFNQEVKDLVDNMWDTLYNISSGVGLAGNQVGALDSVVVIDINRDEKEKPNPITLINPEIVAFSDEQDDYEEGCLSIPEYFENVTRPVGIEIKYFDVDMKEHKREFGGFLARVMQHEVDHLNGILFFDKITPLKKALSRGKLKKVEQGKIIPDYPMVLPDGTETTVE